MRFRICEAPANIIDREVLVSFFKMLILVVFALVFFDLVVSLASVDQQLDLFTESPAAFLRSHIQTYMYASPSILIGLLVAKLLLWRKYRDAVVEIRSHQVLIIDSSTTLKIPLSEIRSLRVSDIHGLFPFGGGRRFKAVDLIRKRRFFEQAIPIRIEPQATCDEFVKNLNLTVPVSYRDLDKLFKKNSSS